MATAKPTPKTKAPEKASGPEPVLVYNERLGPYVANLTRKLKDSERPVGAGKDDPIQNIETVRVVIPPGLFLLDGALYERCAQNDGFASRVDQQAMVIINDDEGEKWADAFNKLRRRVAEEYVEGSADERTLRACLEIAEDDDLSTSIQEQLDAIENESASQRNVRQVQRATNRSKNRGRSRTRGLSRR